MADGGSGRCLSDLSDDLLRHILSFTAASDRAKTAVLSRRWLRLWRTSGDIYLDSRSFTGESSSGEEEREAFHRGSEEALATAAAFGPIRRLTFFIAENCGIDLMHYPKTHPDRRTWSWSEHNLIEAIVTNPAAEHVEELEIDVKPINTRYTLTFSSLPSQALRVLRLTNCAALTSGPAAAAFFPMLVDLHLQNCSFRLVDLQTIIDVTPRLSTLHLASCDFSRDIQTPMPGEEEVVVRLLIPCVSALVLADCTYARYGYKVRLQLDVPRLQCFTYKGHIEENIDGLSLTPRASVSYVDLHFALTNDDANTNARGLFWRFIQNFNTTKVVKLRMDCYTMASLAFTNEASRNERLGGFSFSHLEQLELQAGYEHPAMPSIWMLADLLHCCPILRDLRIESIKKYRSRCWTESSFVEREAGVHFDESFSVFRSRRRRSMVSLGREHDDKHLVPLCRENDDNYPHYDGINPGLNSQLPFSCLQSHLKRVSLHFSMDQPNCLGLRLAKFFGENAMVLQEMHIDDGSQELLEHVNFGIRRWIANTDSSNNQLNVTH